jgi:hypothetical protein
LQTTSELECEEAATGKQLITLFLDSPTLILTDLLLTEGSGVENFAAEDSAQVLLAEQVTTEPVEIT